MVVRYRSAPEPEPEKTDTALELAPIPATIEDEPPASATRRTVLLKSIPTTRRVDQGRWRARLAP